MDKKENKEREKKASKSLSAHGYVVKTKNSELKVVHSKPDSNINPRQINHTHTHF